MKELSIEEKSYYGNYKAHTELINRLEDVKDAIKKQNYGIAMDILCKPYPQFQVITHSELKESEDERIRQFLIQQVTETNDEIMSYRNMNKENVLAWLEKQGNHNEQNFWKKCNYCEYFDGYDLCLNKKNFGAVTNESKENCRKNNFFIEKQGEQKPADKVEPKFKVGDWIICCDYEQIQIIDIKHRMYCWSNGDIRPIEMVDSNSNIRLWTIQDAKDGDVLVDEDNNIGIYKEIEGICWHSYIYLGCDNRLYGFSIGGSHIQSNTKPATKEQHDTLMKAMADAGYTFDFEKKELKMIEQIPAELGENRSKKLSLSLQIQAYLNTASDELYAKGKPLYSEERIKDIHKCMLMWQKLHNAYFYQKPAWSEEDETKIKSIIALLKSPALCTMDGNKGVINENIKYLKSLEERMQPQPKQEWSEEDERVVESILKYYRYMREEWVNWLKSLKDRNTWKPSDEQIKVCKEVYADILSAKGFDLGTVNSELNRLEEELKKLREE